MLQLMQFVTGRQQELVFRQICIKPDSYCDNLALLAFTSW